MTPSMSYASLHVTGTERITPRMVRITLGGEDLAGFTPVAPDQQVKLFFPRPGHVRPVVPEMPVDGDVMTWYQAYMAVPEPERPWMRSYTIRRYHPDRREIEIDFVLHGADGGHGPASRWVARARPGDHVGMYGPSVSHFRVAGAHDWRLLAGDETALPAIGALLEALAPGTRAVVYVEVADTAEEQELESEGDVEIHWLHRGGMTPGHSSVLLDAVRAAELPDGVPFAWIAGEASTVRALRRHLVGERGLDKKQIAFTGYWRLNLTQDDQPTAEDTAEQAEAMA
jgi:NADPH-dependent ferric siderophore reductase